MLILFSIEILFVVTSTKSTSSSLSCLSLVSADTFEAIVFLNSHSFSNISSSSASKVVCDLDKHRKFGIGGIEQANSVCPKCCSVINVIYSGTQAVRKDKISRGKLTVHMPTHIGVIESTYIVQAQGENLYF